jgi:hypothetical protein
MAQMSFFDLSDHYSSLDGKKDLLVEIDAVVPWEEFRPALEQVWRKPDTDRKSRAGRNLLCRGRGNSQKSRCPLGDLRFSWQNQLRGTF